MTHNKKDILSWDPGSTKNIQTWAKTKTIKLYPCAMHLIFPSHFTLLILARSHWNNFMATTGDSFDIHKTFLCKAFLDNPSALFLHLSKLRQLFITFTTCLVYDNNVHCSFNLFSCHKLDYKSLKGESVVYFFVFLSGPSIASQSIFVEWIN